MRAEFLVASAAAAAAKTTAVAGPAHKCDVWVSGPIMVYGGELPNTPVQKNSWEDCCKMCWEDEKFKDACVRICYNHETKECWAHNQGGGILGNTPNSEWGIHLWLPSLCAVQFEGSGRAAEPPARVEAATYCLMVLDLASTV